MSSNNRSENLNILQSSNYLSENLNILQSSKTLSETLKPWKSLEQKLHLNLYKYISLKLSVFHRNVIYIHYVQGSLNANIKLTVSFDFLNFKYPVSNECCV